MSHLGKKMIVEAKRKNLGSGVGFISKGSSKATSHRGTIKE
jgi:hypothetical protein